MRWLVWMLGVLAMAGEVLAQEYDVKPPAKVVSDSSMAIQWLIMAVFLVATLVVAFKPAKRSKLE